MPDVYLGLGSNLQPERHLQLAVRELAARFDLRAVSSVYRNAAIGFDGEDFLNAVACVHTGKPAEQVATELEEIHDLAGRRRGADAFVSRTLDIDLLLYGDDVIEALHVPRGDVLEYSFVLRPLAEMAPDLVHPVTGRCLSEHWADFDQASHRLVAEPGILLNGGR